MTTSAPSNAGVATTPHSVAVPPRTVYIVGFAPSWPQTPWNIPYAERWGMNALHKVASDRPFNRWFQLHNVEKSHPNDLSEHLSWLANFPGPVYMWAEEAVKYPFPNVVVYPREQIIEHFGTYFTNTVSWMIALAIMENFQKIGVYGVDMAQDTEYTHQRPSCEFFLGWAKGKGIEVEIPETSDLLKSPWLYGYEDGGPFRAKLEARRKELVERKAGLEQQRDGAQQVILQLMGAIEDVDYILRAWSQPTFASDGKASTP